MCNVYPTDDEFEEMGELVYCQAQEIFRMCDAEKDFCKQGGGLVFGGTNRVRLQSNGWVAIKSHCTDEFYDKFQALMKRRFQDELGS